jgi:hypothetical protein
VIWEAPAETGGGEVGDITAPSGFVDICKISLYFLCDSKHSKKKEKMEKSFFSFPPSINNNYLSIS